MEDLEPVDFRSGKGAISHVTLYGDAAPVPEPGTIVRMGLGLVGLAVIGREKIKSQYTHRGTKTNAGQSTSSSTSARSFKTTQEAGMLVTGSQRMERMRTRGISNSARRA